MTARSDKLNRGGVTWAKHCGLVMAHKDLRVLCDVVHPVDTHESECPEVNAATR